MCPNEGGVRGDRDDCRPFASRLEAFVDGDLDATECERLVRHLDGCGACRDQVDLARSVARELRALPALDAPDHVVESVLAAVRQDRARSRASGSSVSGPWWRAVLGPLPVGAALAAALLAALWLVPGRLDQTGSDRMAVEAPQTVDAVEVERAAAEARWALAYVSGVSRRTGERIRDDVIAKRWIGSTAEGLRAVSASPPTAKKRPQEESARHET